MALACGCTPDASGFGYCGECTSSLRKKIWANMSEDKKAYDRHFDAHGSRELDDALRDEGCCYCHISPPCSFCVEGGGEYEQDTIEVCA